MVSDTLYILKEPLKNIFCIVIPVYNEINTLPIVLKEIENLSSSFDQIEIRALFVDDGSTDGSRDWIKNVHSNNVSCQGVFHEVNQGIGAALNTGFKHAEGDWIAIISADNQFSVDAFEKALPYLHNTDIISYYRMNKTDYSFFRHFVSKTNYYFNRFLFGLKIKDINWVKIYKKWILDEITIESTSPFIESERLIKAIKKGASIAELESPYSDRAHGKGSGTKLSNVFNAIKDLTKLFWKLKFSSKK